MRVICKLLFVLFFFFLGFNCVIFFGRFYLALVAIFICVEEAGSWHQHKYPMKYRLRTLFKLPVYFYSIRRLLERLNSIDSYNKLALDSFMAMTHCSSILRICTKLIQVYHQQLVTVNSQNQVKTQNLPQKCLGPIQATTNTAQIAVSAMGIDTN